MVRHLSVYLWPDTLLPYPQQQQTFQFCIAPQKALCQQASDVDHHRCHLKPVFGAMAAARKNRERESARDTLAFYCQSQGRFAGWPDSQQMRYYWDRKDNYSPYFSIPLNIVRYYIFFYYSLVELLLS